MERARRVDFPKRKMRKVTLTLPVDLIEMLDECAGATGRDRSDFLTTVLDGFYDEVISFTRGIVTQIQVQAQALAQSPGAVEERTKKGVETLTGGRETMTFRRRQA